MTGQEKLRCLHCAHIGFAHIGAHRPQDQADDHAEKLAFVKRPACNNVRFLPTFIVPRKGEALHSLYRPSMETLQLNDVFAQLRLPTKASVGQFRANLAHAMSYCWTAYYAQQIWQQCGHGSGPIGADEHPCTTYFDVHQGNRVLTHSHNVCSSLGGL